MSHRNDDKYAAFAPEGPPAHMDDLEDLWHGGPQDNDGWFAFFQTYGATSENYNDAAYEFLIARGMTAAALPDMWAEFWAGGGVVGLTNNVINGVDNVINGVDNVVTVI
jgi:hypothetical protein